MTGLSLAALLVASAAAKAPYTDYRGQAPGVKHLITPADLPPPFETPDVDNQAELVARPKDAWPRAPRGFVVERYAEGLENPRLIRVAPNGDLFVAESEPGRVRVFRGVDALGKPRAVSVFAAGLNLPFGIVFYPPGPAPRYVYIGDTDAVVRFPYRSGDLKASGKPEKVLRLPAGGFLEGGGHWTRDVAFSRDGKTMFVSVGSRSNVADVDADKREFHRACILASSPDGSGVRVFASGLRNAVGIAVDPATGALWASVDERDRLGDDLPPDYITSVRDGGFYGWPWYYIGGHADPRLPERHPRLKARTIVPDVLIQAHDASLELTFYKGDSFPASLRGDIFAAEHGSWNRAVRTGYEVIRVPTKDGKARGGYEDFLTGFVTSDGRVWGRPVGVAVAADGSLIVSDDGSNSLWRVRYAPSRGDRH